MTKFAETFWEERKAEYPYHAQAPMMDPTPSDVASTFDADAIGPYIAAPISPSLVYWGFKTELGRAAFLATFVTATELSAEAVFGNYPA